MNYWTMDKYGFGIDNKTIWQIKDRMPNNIEKKNIDGGNRQSKHWMDVLIGWNWKYLMEKHI